MARPSEEQNARNVLILTGVGHFSAHFFELMFPTLAVALALQTRVPLADVFGWSFAAYLLFGLCALPAGWLGDRLGARLLLIVGLFGLGVASLAASEAPNGRVLSISLAAMGACASAFHPLGRNLISRTIAARGRARRIHDVSGNVALALTPLIVAVLCARVGWQASYRLVGYALCAVAVACAFLRIDDRDRAHPAPPPPPPVSEARRPLVLLLAAAVLAGITYRGFTMIVPSYLAAHMTTIGFGAATSLVYLIGVCGQYTAGMLAERHDQRRLYFACSALALAALLLMSALTGLLSIGGAAVFAFFLLGLRPIEDKLFFHYAPARWHAAAIRSKAALTVGVGAVGIWVVQWADAAGGLSFALLCLAGVTTLLIASAAALVAVDRPRADSSTATVEHWPALVRPAVAPVAGAAPAVPAKRSLP